MSTNRNVSVPLLALICTGLAAAQTGLLQNYAGNGVAGFSGDNGPAISASFASPFGIGLDASGDLFISASGNARVQAVIAASGIIVNVAGGGTGGAGGLATAAALTGPCGVALDFSGDLYISDTCVAAAGGGGGGGSGANGSVSRIWRVDAITGIITSVAGAASSGFSGDGGPATSALLNVPVGLAIDASGDIFVADSSNCRIRRIDAITGVITTVAGNGTAAFAGDGGPATSASLNTPSGVAVDSMGNLFIADAMNNRIRRVDAVTGIITTVAGTGSASFNGDGIPAVSASLNTPFDVRLNSAGNLIIADSENYRIRMVDMSSGLIWTVAGNGSTPSSGCGSGAGGKATQAALSLPVSVAVSPSGPLYISELRGNCVQVVSLPSPFADTAVTISANGGSTIPAGTPAMLTATLSAINGLAASATGSVAFFDGTNTLLGQVAVANGSAAFTTSSLSQGKHTINAIYSGDPAFAYAVAPLFALTITAPQATVALAATPNPAPPNQAITLTATLTPSTATGTVTFLNGGSTLGTATIANGVATLSGVMLAPGTYSLTAQYSGNSTFPAATSPAVNLTVKAASTVVVTSSANPSITGQAVTFTATVTPPAATGSVQFSDGSTILGTSTLTNGAASFTPTSLTQGAHSITASYAGDANDQAATSAVFTQTVQAASTVTITSNANPVVVGGIVTIFATVTPTSATGTVQFFDGTTLLGTSALASGAASFTTTSLTQGTHQITATYSGDASDGSATSAVLSESIKLAIGFALAVTPNPAVAGQTVTMTVNINPAATGTVTFADGTTTLATVPLTSGTAAYSTSSLALGTHSLNITYSGDSTYLSAGTTYTETILAASSVALSSSVNPAASGQTVTFTAAVTPSAATGTVQFYDGAALLGTSTLTNGIATYSTSSLAVGTHSITANYTGNATYGASNSTALSQAVKNAVGLTAGYQSPIVAGQTETVTANMNSSATGTVTFSNGGTVLATVPVSAGTASYASSSLTQGTTTIGISYSGDSNFLSASTTVTITVLGSTTITIASSVNPAVSGQSITFSATVTPAAATGTVQFYDGSTLLATTALTNGVAAFSTAVLAAGTHSVTANYTGSATYNASSSGALPEVVKAATSVALSTSANPAIAGSAVTFTAAVTPSSATGTVQFYDGATLLGSATLGGGTGHFSTSALAPGMHSITAVYSGDALDVASTSGTLVETINAAVPSAPSNLSATAASSSQINLAWTASATSGVTYNIYESTTAGFTPSASNRIATGVGTTSFAASGLAASTTYYYRVTAVNSGGESADTNQASATTSGAFACHVSYSVTSQWSNGFTSAVSIENTGTIKVTSWKLTWTWPGNQAITESWDATYSQSGANATLNSESYNGQLNPGATASGIGFNASYKGTNSAPPAFYVNGTLCH